MGECSRRLRGRETVTCGVCKPEAQTTTRGPLAVGACASENFFEIAIESAFEVFWFYHYLYL